MTKSILRRCLQIRIDCGLNADSLLGVRFQTALSIIHRAVDGIDVVRRQLVAATLEGCDVEQEAPARLSANSTSTTPSRAMAAITVSRRTRAASGCRSGA